MIMEVVVETVVEAKTEAEVAAGREVTVRVVEVLQHIHRCANIRDPNPVPDLALMTRVYV